MEFEYNEEIASGKSFIRTFQEQLSPEEREAVRIRVYYEQKDRELYKMLFCPEIEPEDDNDEDEKMFDMIPAVEGNLSFNFSPIKRNSLGEDDVGGFGIGCDLSPVKDKPTESVTEATFLTQSQHADNNVEMGCDFSPIKASCNNEDVEYTKFSQSIQGNSSVDMENDDLDDGSSSSSEEDDDDEGISFSDSRKIIHKKFLSFFDNNSDGTSNDTMFYSIIDTTTMEENNWNSYTFFNLTAYSSIIADN